MPAVIRNLCTNCGICLPVCPTASIHRGESKHVVDSDTCEECRHCAEVCPVNAVKFPSTPRPVAPGDS